MTDWPPSKTEIAAFFNGRAASYDRSDMHRWLASQTVQHMNLPQWGTFLDLGAGTGLASREIAARVDKLQSRFIAIDLASDLLAAARSASSESFILETIEADVEDLPLDDDTADAAVCVAAIAYLHNPRRALREWHRVLRPGGQLGFQVFAANTMTAPRVFREAAAAQGLLFTDPNEAIGTPDVINTTLVDAGSVLEDIASAAWSTSIPNADTFWSVMSSGVLAMPLARLDSETKEELRIGFTSRLDEATEAKSGREDHVCYFRKGSLRVVATAGFEQHELVFERPQGVGCCRARDGLILGSLPRSGRPMQEHVVCTNVSHDKCPQWGGREADWRLTKRTRRKRTSVLAKKSMPVWRHGKAVYPFRVPPPPLH